MELLQLRYFYDCARFESIAKTAGKHNVPASSVSATIRRLEEELGNKLFNRTSNRITLNENGIRLKNSLDRIFSELDQAVTDIVCPTDEKKIRLLVRTMRAEATEYIIEYRNKHPNVAFEFVMDMQDGKFGDYDVIIDEANDRYLSYDSFVMKKRRLLLRASVDHPLCGRELTLGQLKDQFFVTMGGNMHDRVVKACQNAGFTPNVVAKINDIMCYQKVLRSGIAIGHARESFAGPGVELCYLNVTDFNEFQSLCVYFKPDISGSTRNFVEFLMTKRE